MAGARSSSASRHRILTRDSSKALGAGAPWRDCCAVASSPEEVAAAVRGGVPRAVDAPLTSSPPWAGGRWPRRARRVRESWCTCINTARVCAVGVCFTQGQECTRCHGRNTLPGGALRNCRGSRAQALAYGAGLALWQRRLARSRPMRVVVPSVFARERLRALGAPLPWERVHSCWHRRCGRWLGSAAGEGVWLGGARPAPWGFEIWQWVAGCRH